MIHEIDSSNIDMLDELIQKYLDHKEEKDQSLAHLKQQVSKGLSNKSLVLLAESCASDIMRGFLLFSLKNNNMHVLYADRVYESEKALFDELLRRYPERVPMMVFESGYPTPWVSEQFSGYSIEKGFVEHVRGYLRLEPIIEAKLESRSLPDGYEFIPFEDSERLRTADLVYRCVESTIDQKLFPSIFSTRSTIDDFLEKVLQGEYGTHKKGYSWVLQDSLEYHAAVFMVVNQETGFVAHIVVNPTQRRKGLGRALLVHSIKSLHQSDKSIKRIELAVTWSNPARFLYESLGFELVNKSSTFVWKG